jgi:hypothetical protein
VGSVDGKTGAFTLLHNGYMSSERQSLEIQIVEGTGTGELANIQGTLEITMDYNIGIEDPPYFDALYEHYDISEPWL